MSVDAGTERIGSCYNDRDYRAAFVGLNRRGGAAWVLFTCSSQRTTPTLQTDHVTIWKVTDKSLILSEGVELPISASFQAKLHTYDRPEPSLRSSLEHDDAGAALEVDAHTGQVRNASPAGCA